MIRCLACTCGSAEPIIRRALREAHYPDWLTTPVLKGKSNCLAYLNGVPGTEDLREYISKSSSWTVILGVSPNSIRWVDLRDGPTGRVDGGIIIKEYGNEAS